MRAWEIYEKDHESRDSRYGHRMGMREHTEKMDKLVDDIYECGFEDGYKKAQEEMGSYGERGSYKRM